VPVDWPEPDVTSITQAYDLAKAGYAALGVDTDAAIARALAVPISLHCWQADDVVGLEYAGGGDTGGILATGHYPGRACTGDEMRADLDQVLALAPGTLRANLHAMYAETGEADVDRDALAPEHFARWIDWAKARGIALDFNPTFFAHPMAESGFTLSHADDGVRAFWVRHAVACRHIGEAMAKACGSPSVVNVWIPDGSKDYPADRFSPRRRLAEALDQAFDPSHGVDTSLCVDAVESKLFGIGSEAYVVGSFEFYTAYALTRGVVKCLDMGHFQPTETIDDKLSALLGFHDRLLLHVSRPMRWDSDHVVLFSDETRAVFQELVRGGALERVYVALDFFDASINRLAAYVIGTRAVRKAVLAALVEPVDRLKALEAEGDGAGRLALMEELKTMPLGAVWNRLCAEADAPPAGAWMNAVRVYERDVLAKRS